MQQPSTASRAELFRVAGLLTLLAVVGCQRGDSSRPASTTTARANVAAPQATATSSRTIDNTGFVDNAGRTSDMVGRSEASGMRGTEAGGDRPIGTPGSGTPIPVEGRPQRSHVGEGRGAASSVRGTSSDDPQPSGSPAIDAVARIARARCDRETACNRVGEGRPFKTQDSCVVQQRERARAGVEALACPRGLDIHQLGTCLNGIRLQGCNDSRIDVEALPECAASALCAPGR